MFFRNGQFTGVFVVRVVHPQEQLRIVMNLVVK